MHAAVRARPSFGYVHPPDILCFEGLGVLEGGTSLLLLQLPVHDLTILTARPAGTRWEEPEAP
jgi:hypothetical protein